MRQVAIFLVLLLVAVTAWGQYWYDRAHRMMDTIRYMIEEEIDDE